jgi:hypothetical protein
MTHKPNSPRDPPRRPRSDPKELPDRFQLLIECRDEAQQRRLYEWLVARKYVCRVMVL